MVQFDVKDITYVLFSGSRWGIPDVLVSTLDLTWVFEHSIRWGSVMWALCYIANRPYVDANVEPIRELIEREQVVYGDREWGYEYGMSKCYRSVNYF